MERCVGREARDRGSVWFSSDQRHEIFEISARLIRRPRRIHVEHRPVALLGDLAPPQIWNRASADMGAARRVVLSVSPATLTLWNGFVDQPEQQLLYADEIGARNSETKRARGSEGSQALTFVHGGGEGGPCGGRRRTSGAHSGAGGAPAELIQK